MAYRNRVKTPLLQARIFLPQWYVKVVHPGKPIADDVVQLHVSLDMGKIDIRNYLEKIYGIPVDKVHTRIQPGKWKNEIYGNDLIHKKNDDYKVAYVYLREGTFKFPQLFPEISTEEVEEEEEVKAPATIEERTGASTWFNL